MALGCLGCPVGMAPAGALWGSSQVLLHELEVAPHWEQGNGKGEESGAGGSWAGRKGPDTPLLCPLFCSGLLQSLPAHKGLCSSVGIKALWWG